MPNVVLENTDNQTSVITVNLPRADYETKLTNQLKKYRKEAHIKGFRKGKVPMNFIKKNYGQALLADIINESMQQEMYKIMEEGGDQYLGQPVALAEQKEYEFNVDKLEDYEFKFEIGLKPDFTVKGIDKKKAHQYYDVQVASDTIDTEIENARKRSGERVLDEEKIVEGDLVRFDAKELADGKVKEDGVTNEFSLLWEKIIDEDLKKTLLKSKKGDTVTFNVFEVEADTDASYVKKHILGISDEEDTEVGEMFEATITEVSRIELAELNEEFFTQTFGEDVKTEEEARAFIEKEIKKSYEQTADAILFRNVQDYLMDKNKADITLPDDFMKRFLVSQSDQNTPELVEEGYDDFADNLRWTLMRGQLYDKYEIKVEESDLRKGFEDRISQYMGGYATPEMLQGTVERMLQDQKMVEDMANGIATDRLMLKLKEDLKLKEEKISTEDFNKVVEELNKKINAEREANQEEEE